MASVDTELSPVDLDAIPELNEVAEDIKKESKEIDIKVEDKVRYWTFFLFIL